MKTHEHNGHTITIEWHHDEDTEAPWEHEDGHGPVSEWTRSDKKPHELVLVSDRGSRRYYDAAAATKLAKTDGWGLATPQFEELTKRLGHKPTRKEVIAEAVRRDFEHLRRWCDDQWYWCGYVVTIEGTDYHESLWGIDSDSQDEYEKEAVAGAQAWIDRETAEASDAAARDICTV